jgi:DNA (cytosine-5)-methyltransferase 1
MIPTEGVTRDSTLVALFLREDMSTRSNRLKAIDLFSGCGGLTTGLKRAGFQVVAGIEIDSLATSTYQMNHPEVQLLQKDIRRVSGKGLMRSLGLRKGQIDLVAGCPPCQGFSTMRTLNGCRAVRDSSKNLVFEFVRFVRAFLPRTVMMENVPGLAEDIRMRRVLKTLEKLGYTCECRILDASDYGVPQRRKRMILIGSRFGPIEFADRVQPRRTVRQAIGSLPKPGTSGDPLHDLTGKHGPKVLALIKRIRRNGGSRTELSQRHQLECHKSTTGFKDVYGRMAWNRVAPTITTGCINPSKGRFLHPTQNRAITLREAALLQTFPRRYRFSLKSGRFPVANLIGNALPPEFVRRHAREISHHLRKNAR